jgi:hypothetical protein
MKSAGILFNLCICALLLVSSTCSVFSNQSSLTVFLDHNDFVGHAEVAFSVATAIMMKYNEVTNFHWIFHDKFVKFRKYDEYLKKYAANNSIISPFNYSLRSEYSTLFQKDENGILTFNDSLRSLFHYDIRVLLTVHPPLVTSEYNVLEDDEHFVLVTHHMEMKSPIYMWQNVLCLSNSRAAQKRCSWTLTPSYMPIPIQLPNYCEPPVFIIQGALERRFVKELEYILEIQPHLNITVKILSNQSPVPNVIKGDSRVFLGEFRDTIHYMEALWGASILLPLIHPAHDRWTKYLSGHPTSTIAYSIHFQIPMIAHFAVKEEYFDDLTNANVPCYEHDGTKASIQQAAKKAYQEIRSKCKQS